MMSAGTFDNKPLEAWKGQFGDEYTVRNTSEELFATYVKMWERIARSFPSAPKSVLEVGPNVGGNLRAIAKIFPAKLFAVEPNDSARRVLVADKVVPADQVFEGFGHSLPMNDQAAEFVFTGGVLIHVDRALLDKTLREIHRVSSRYIGCIEYFSASPDEIPYRGNRGLLFRDDYGSLYMDRFPDLKLVDYGFFWRRSTGLDNLTWWLFEKG